ncbi:MULTISPECIES: tetratricopeptide repeat protein [unclassified Thioalkalivibrio]|uniref:tetratricopeptide repeat protein n=1 Tax=unclassified Thioalkalivibrio TaxID=2621013 RepID=UPI000367A086|nr:MULTISPECIES: SEL1-like repeat protein [unclassified Thioalkalivibrio]
MSPRIRQSAFAALTLCFASAVSADPSDSFVELGDLERAHIQYVHAEAKLADELWEASKGGDADATYAAAVMHENGTAGHRSPELARQLYREAAQAGHRPAQIALARMLIAGSGGKPDASEALKWMSADSSAGRPSGKD